MCQKWDEDQTSVSYYKSQRRSNPLGPHEAIAGHSAWEQNVGDIGGYTTLSVNLCTRGSPLFLNCIYRFYKKCARKIKISRDMNEYSKKKFPYFLDPKPPSFLPQRQQHFHVFCYCFRVILCVHMPANVYIHHDLHFSSAYALGTKIEATP